MKKILCIILSVLVLFLAACTPSAPEDTTTVATTTVATTEAPEEQGIKNIILVIGDGMGVDQVQAGELAASKKFAFTSWQHTLVDTNSLNGNLEPLNTTDSAAAATALATGVLTKNGRIGQDADGKNLKTIMDYAKEYGKATGVITTDKIQGATPSGFSGHATERTDYDSIIISQIQSGMDLLCATSSSEAMEKRATIKDMGYTFSYSFFDAKNSMDAEKNYWLLSLNGPKAPDKLCDVTSLALDYLSQDKDGFVLMIEQANIDGFGHKNEFDGLPQCVNILSDTVDTILEWIGDREDTAILITADHETGGLDVTTEPIYTIPYICANGESMYYNFTTMTHTNSYVDLFVYGFEPDFTQFYTEERPDAIKNINIFDMMLNLLEDPLQENN